MDLKFSIDAQDDETLKLDKFFQFTVVGDKTECDFHRVSQFNAIVFRFKCLKRANALNCVLNINSHDVDSEKDIIFSDKSDYYKEVGILKQFWGEKSFVHESENQFVNKVNEVFNLSSVNQEELRDDVDIIYSQCKGRFPIIINENKDGIEPFILIPIVSHFKSSNKVTLKTLSLARLKHLQKFISFGFWFNCSFQRKLKLILNEVLLNSKIEFDRCVKCPDFKVYYQVDSNVKVKSNSIIIDKGESEPVKGEIIRVFSQSKIKYFKEWAELGIYNSALFRFENNRKINSLILNEGVKTINADMYLEDALEAGKKQVQVFILSIILSVLVSMGFDATRQSTVAFKSLFPHIPYLSNEFTWALLCIGVASKYFYFFNKSFKISTLRKVFAFLMSMLLFFWLAACFFVDSTFIVEKLDCNRVEPLAELCFKEPIAFGFIHISSWLQILPLVDIVFSSYLIVAILLNDYYLKNKRTLHRFFKRFLELTFGVR
ncbi:hypothetical protein ACROAK_03530 [Shewanella oncorhynchi]|uniref:hypothetical protein n=1 Tax=Shewanella oncorhynchi TaxID=2726434 RepID=UPI003D7A1F8C